MTDHKMLASKAGLNYADTQQTFAHKTNFQLRKSAFLFRLMGNPRLVTIANSLAMNMVNIGIPVAWAVKPTLYRQFVGGETLEECIPVLIDLKSRNTYSILDYSAEAGSKNTEYDSVVEETIKSISFAKEHDSIPFAVFKPTTIGNTEVLKKVSFAEALSNDEIREFTHFKTRMHKLAQTAAQAKIRLLVDAEDFWYQKAIDDVVFDLMSEFNRKNPIIFNTWQMYRHDRLDHLKCTVQKAQEENFTVGVKLVRGAYMEKERERAIKGGYPSPIHCDKESTDNSYNSALEFCVENLSTLEIFNGTHNEFSSSFLAGVMIEKGIKKDHPGIWFAQLYGMSDHITSQLSVNGYNVTKYVPYGSVNKVLPYLSRRAQENTSVKGQTGRELSLISKEIKRRRRS